MPRDRDGDPCAAAAANSWRERSTAAAAGRYPTSSNGSKRPPLFKSSGGSCCLMLDPCYSSMYLDDEGTYVCKAFSPRCYVIQKVKKLISLCTFVVVDLSTSKCQPQSCGTNCRVRSASAFGLSTTHLLSIT